MTNETVQKNKALVWEFWNKFNESQASDKLNIVRSNVHEDISWHGVHPFNDLTGVGALISEFWQPLLHAIPDLQRTTEIFIGGHRHWVGAIGYFSGTFTHDWLGIPATGREISIRFGEFSAVHDGKIGLTYIIPDLLDVIRQAGYQLVPPSLGKEGQITGPLTGDGVLLTPHDNAKGAKTLALAQNHVRRVEHPALRTILGFGSDDVVWA